MIEKDLHDKNKWLSNDEYERAKVKVCQTTRVFPLGSIKCLLLNSVFERDLSLVQPKETSNEEDTSPSKDFLSTLDPSDRH